MKENVHAHIDEDVMRGVRAYAAEHGISLAAAMAVLLRDGLAHQPNGGEPSNETTH